MLLVISNKQKIVLSFQDITTDEKLQYNQISNTPLEKKTEMKRHVQRHCRMLKKHNYKWNNVIYGSKD